LSFGSESGRTRSGTKGFSGREKKKQRRKKQEFHTHRRAHLQESGRPNPEEVTARTMLALDRLGHQVLSTEPGGYDLQDWMRNLNSLLDDFQERVGADWITDEFRARRDAALVSLSQPSFSGDIDSEMEKLGREEGAAKEALAGLQRESAARLASLREERDACAKDLKLARERLAELKEAKRSRQFFSRLIGGGPPTEPAEARVAELEAKQSRLDSEIDHQRKARTGVVDSSSQGGEPARLEAQMKLQDVRKRLEELRSARESKLQLSHEREVATKTISDLISSMRPRAPELDGNPTGEQR